MKSKTGTLIDLAFVWGIASAFGFGAMAGLMLLGGWTLFQGLFAAAVLFLALGGLLTVLFMKPLPGPVRPGTAGRASGAVTAARTDAGHAPSAPAPVPVPVPAAPEAAAPVAPASETPQASADGRPVSLDGPRGGGADDLKRIKGIGPKLEALCHSMGYYHYDQIAAWTSAEVAWVDENLEGFKGRVVRDDWVAQARELAGGGDTAFSRKVDSGDVY